MSSRNQKVVTSTEHSQPTNKLWLSTFITSLGNFSVQANFQAISIALIVMSVDVCTSNDDACRKGEQDAWVSGSLTAIVFAGSICGQLTMGYAGDVLGRDAAMAFTLSIATLAAMASALPMGSANEIYIILMFCRFVLGIGLGGVYPLAATKAAEDSSSGGRANNQSSAKSFFWQAPGAMFPWILALILVQTDMSSQAKWRLLLGIGSVPLAIAVAACFIESRLKGKPAVVAKTTNLSAFTLLKDKDMLLKLVGTGGTWFIFDVCYYGVGLFGGAILSALNDRDDDNITTSSSITLIAWQEAIALGAGIPAYLLTNYHIKKYGMKKIQIVGFIFTALLFLLMASLFDTLKSQSPEALYALYVLLLFSLCYGPNVTTYILPASVYDKNVRSTMNGISAASGKLGAVVGAYLFGAIATVTSYATVMAFCCALSLLGAYITYKFIEDGLDYDLEGKSSMTTPLISEHSDNGVSLHEEPEEIYA